MAGNKVCAVVVTFHPRAKDIINLERVRPQVGALVVVDNGSSGEELNTLRTASYVSDFTLIENGTNLGIGTALNRGVSWAIQHGNEWVVLFDQDSTVTAGFVEFMLSDFNHFSGERDVMQIIPRYRDPETGEEEIVARDVDGGPYITRTSGSLFPVVAFEKCGFFAEELFIYCVDDDFSLRLRSKGFSIAQSENAVLLHSAGNVSRFTLFGRSFTTRNYRPEVQYYWARNRVWLMRKYGSQHPHLIYSSLRSLVGVPLKIVLGERSRWQKIRWFIKGLVDGICGKTGQRVNVC